ncbi:alpha-ketoacid dehydrogenase subunit beta [Nisaea sp.]|uniref:alpha-ketoacid dehydrogenase subunit beta n=1 Tax=Nisaea sp. TaxID=2024842 RepID=UPI003B52F37A
MSTPKPSDARTLTFGEALYEATRQEMQRDPSVFVMGLGVDDPIGLYGTTKDLHKDFGPDRNFDTPLAEDAMTGVAIGAALNGMRPIHVHQRMDFLMLCMNQLVNVAAKQHYMFAGNYSAPIVVRASIGRSWGQGAQHSQAFHSYFMHVPGIRVIAPTTPHDAKGGLISAIRDNNPVVFVEHRMLYKLEGIVPEEPFEIPLGKARILREGGDVTIVGISHMVVECLRAANCLNDVGISAEVIDPIWLAPLDIEAICRSVKKTGRLVVVDNGWTTCGASSEIMAQVFERMGDAPPKMARLGFKNIPCPTTRILEDEFYPDSGTIAKQAAILARPEDFGNWTPPTLISREVEEFRGPF